MSDRDFNIKLRTELDEMVPYQPGRPVEEIRREYNLDFEPVKLASNENPYPPPSELREAYINEFASLNRYPDGGCYYLVEKLAEKYDWPAEGIIVGAGSDEVLDCLAKTMLSPGDEVLTGDPAFIRYRMGALMMGASSVEVPVDNNYDFDLERMATNITDDTRWICIPNPNNPTARYIKEDDLLAFLDEVPAHCLVILDEAYFEFMDQEDYPDGVDILKYSEDNLGCSIVVLRTFSKAYGLSGLRVGYGLMEPQLAAEVHKVRPPFNVTRPSQAVALAALKDDSYLETVREGISSERQRLQVELEQRGFNVIDPSANFMLIEVSGEFSAGVICEELLQLGVIVRSMLPYGLENCFRLSVGQPEENDKFLAALDEIGGY